MLKTVSTLVTIASWIMLFSVTVCGLWIRFNPQTADGSSVRFHVMLGVLTVGIVTVTLIVHALLIKQLSA